MAQYELLDLLGELKGGKATPSTTNARISAVQMALAEEAQRKALANEELAELLGSVEAIDLSSSQLRNHQANIIGSIKQNIAQLYKQKNGKINEEDRAAISTELTRLKFHQNKMQNIQSFFNEANDKIEKSPEVYDRNMIAAEWSRFMEDPMNYTPEKTNGFGETGNPFLTYMTTDPFFYLSNNMAGYDRIAGTPTKTITEDIKGNKKYTTTKRTYGNREQAKNFVIQLAAQNPNFMKGISQGYSINTPEELQNAYSIERQRSGTPESIQAFFDTEQYKAMEDAMVNRVDTRETAYKPTKEGKGFSINFGRGRLKYGDKVIEAGEFSPKGGHTYTSYIDVTSIPTSKRKLTAYNPQGEGVKLMSKGKRSPARNLKSDYLLSGIDTKTGVITLEQKVPGSAAYVTVEYPLKDNESALMNLGIDIEGLPEPKSERTTQREEYIFPYKGEDKETFTDSDKDPLGIF